MAMDQGEEMEANVKGTKRKSPHMQDTISSDEEDAENSVDDTGLVNDLLASKREAEDRLQGMWVVGTRGPGHLIHQWTQNLGHPC